MSDIFKSRFKMEFKSKEMEKAYQNMRDKNMKFRNIIYSAINLVLSIINNFLYNFTYQANKSQLYNYVNIICFVLTPTHFIFLLLSIFIKNPKAQRWFSYVNISALILNNMGSRLYFSYVVNADYVILIMIFNFQQIYPMTWFFTNNLEFFDGFWVYLQIAIVCYVVYAPLMPSNLQYRGVMSGAIIMTASFISYFYMQEKKNSFYFNFKNESTIKSYKSIIQNMNSGFISVKNSRIVGTNKNLRFLLKMINNLVIENYQVKNSVNQDTIITSENTRINSGLDYMEFESLGPEKNKHILIELFREIKFDAPVENEENLSDYELSLNYLKNFSILNLNLKEDFIFLGTKAFKFQNEDNNMYYEIFGRYCNLFKVDEEENFEFIFNDVSKTKIREEINAEMKYKSLFLSKVAHEFKNPLICVSELVDQVNEELDSNKHRISNMSGQSSSNYHNCSNKVKDSLIQIKSMCEYLLILVKDLDFFSLKYSGSTNKIKLEKENVKLNNVLKYCEIITNVLLKKYQKEENIRFIIDCNKELYQKEVFTDEVRLKQLLINLLSNSVKYTYHGQIILEIKEEDEEIVFNVIDTGKGLTEVQKTRLNTNMEVNREISGFSSGLGFSIIKEIIDLLGSNLVYSSQENQGSIFSFKIKKVQNMEVSRNLVISENIPAYLDSSSSEDTLQKEFSAIKSPDVFFEISNLEKGNRKSELRELDNKEINLKFDIDSDYILVVDDENITRKSAIRMFNNYFNSHTHSNKKKIILEASDGIECLHLFYQCIKKGIRLSFIISDMTMEFMDGISCAKILDEITKSKGLKHVPFYILSAYEELNVSSKIGIDKAFSKPLSMKNIEEIILSLQT